MGFAIAAIVLAGVSIILAVYTVYKLYETNANANANNNANSSASMRSGKASLLRSEE